MKSITKISMIAAMLVASFSASAQKKVLEFNQLPKTAQSFVNTHYNKGQISLVSSEKEMLSGMEYKVVLQNGTEIEFDQKGNWTEVDAKQKSVPQAIIPASILNYVRKSFPNNEVVQLKKERNGFEVELTSGLDLEFNKKGEFVRIDD